MENNFVYAGFWKRFLAYIIDEIILGIAQSILILPIFFVLGLGIFSKEFKGIDNYALASNSFISQTDEYDIAFLGAIFGTILIMGLVSIILQWLYFALMESSSKQASLGKMALGIIVVDTDGNRISFARATGRYFGKIISGLILNFGYIMAGFTRRKQALHDMLADCLVILE